MPIPPQLWINTSDNQYIRADTIVAAHTGAYANGGMRAEEGHGWEVTLVAAGATDTTRSYLLDAGPSEQWATDTAHAMLHEIAKRLSAGDGGLIWSDRKIAFAAFSGIEKFTPGES